MNGPCIPCIGLHPQTLQPDHLTSSLTNCCFLLDWTKTMSCGPRSKSIALPFSMAFKSSVIALNIPVSRRLNIMTLFLMLSRATAACLIACVNVIDPRNRTATGNPAAFSRQRVFSVCVFGAAAAVSERETRAVEILHKIRIRQNA